MSNSKKLSVSKIKKLIRLFKFIVSQKSNDKTTCLAFLNENSVDDISESIYNILYNEKLNSNFSKSQKSKLKRISKPNAKSFKHISKTNIPVRKRQSSIVQHGTGIGTVLLTLIPILTSLLSKK